MWARDKYDCTCEQFVLVLSGCRSSAQPAVEENKHCRLQRAAVGHYTLCATTFFSSDQSEKKSYNTSSPEPRSVVEIGRVADWRKNWGILKHRRLVSLCEWILRRTDRGRGRRRRRQHHRRLSDLASRGWVALLPRSRLPHQPLPTCFRRRTPLTQVNLERALLVCMYCESRDNGVSYLENESRVQKVQHDFSAQIWMVISLNDIGFKWVLFQTWPKVLFWRKLVWQTQIRELLAEFSAAPVWWNPPVSRGVSNSNGTGVTGYIWKIHPYFFPTRVFGLAALFLKFILALTPLRSLQPCEMADRLVCGILFPDCIGVGWAFHFLRQMWNQIAFFVLNYQIWQKLLLATNPISDFEDEKSPACVPAVTSVQCGHPPLLAMVQVSGIVSAHWSPVQFSSGDTTFLIFAVCKSKRHVLSVCLTSICHSFSWRGATAFIHNKFPLSNWSNKCTEIVRRSKCSPRGENIGNLQRPSKHPERILSAHTSCCFVWFFWAFRCWTIATPGIVCFKPWSLRKLLTSGSFHVLKQHIFLFWFKLKSMVCHRLNEMKWSLGRWHQQRWRRVWLDDVFCVKNVELDELINWWPYFWETIFVVPHLLLK